MKNKQTQQEIPFKLEGNTAPRRVIRNIATTADGLHKVPFSKIKIRPKFNARRKPDGVSEEMYEQSKLIPQLADGIYANNGTEPIRGDFYAADECFYITNGERRYRAMRRLLNSGREIYPNGQPVDQVLVMINPAGTTDLERKRMVITTQDNLKLTPVERGYYYLSFKTDDGMTHDEIAAYLNVSRQTVDNYILATELPADVQDKIDTDEIKISAALADYRLQHKKKKGSIAEVDLDTGEVFETEAQAERKKAEEKEKDKIRGDEDEFIQQDNSITSPGSMAGPKESGSGAHVLGTDSIYVQKQKEALWKQFVHRYEKLKSDIIDARVVKRAGWEDELAERLGNEYNLTVK